MAVFLVCYVVVGWDGTTVLAAVVTGYRAVGIEVTDAYYKLGSDRVRIALEAEQKEDEK